MPRQGAEQGRPWGNERQPRRSRGRDPARVPSVGDAGPDPSGAPAGRPARSPTGRLRTARMHAICRHGRWRRRRRRQSLRIPPSLPRPPPVRIALHPRPAWASGGAGRGEWGDRSMGSGGPGLAGAGGCGVRGVRGGTTPRGARPAFRRSAGPALPAIPARVMHRSGTRGIASSPAMRHTPGRGDEPPDAGVAQG